MPKKLHPVLIVGAGPGDPQLLTVKAVKALSAAQAVVHDRLIPKSILKMISPRAQTFFAGKARDTHYMKQNDINALLAKLARQGLKVVRLKGGNPVIFGRAGEEAEYLAGRKIPFEIIPGISSASGCSAAFNIPLTHRGLSRGVHYISGHYKDPATELDWPRLADPDTTLVIYMGLANIGIIAEKLMEHGLPKSFPLAAIENGTLKQGKIVTTTLKNAARDVKKEGLESPTLIIVGKVVTLYRKLQKA